MGVDHCWLHFEGFGWEVDLVSVDEAVDWRRRRGSLANDKLRREGVGMGSGERLRGRSCCCSWSEEEEEEAEAGMVTDDESR
jgi:hypothetical protein